VRWGSSASSSTSSSSAHTGTSAHVTTSTAAAAAQAETDTKHSTQAKQAAVEQKQRGTDNTVQPDLAAAAATAAVEQVAAAGQLQITAAASGNAAAAPPLWLARFSAGWVHASLGTVAVSLLEKQKKWGEAVEVRRQQISMQQAMLTAYS
jgi:hypothetical protein